MLIVSRNPVKISRNKVIWTSKMTKNSGNVDIDETDQAAGPEDAGDDAGGTQDQEQQETGISADRSTGPGDLPDELSAEEAAASQAVDRFDQMNAGQSETEEGAPQPGMPDKDAIPGTGVSMAVMEQWLEQIEGDPAYLLLNQFRIEEQQELQRQGSKLMETRPW